MKLKRYFNLRINAFSAAFENQSIGPNLSPFMARDKINQFCLEFNNLTNIYSSNEIEIFVRLNLYSDNSFNFIIKSMKLPFLIKLYFNLDKLNSCKNLNLFILLKLISIKNIFLNLNFDTYIINNILLKNQFKNLYFSIIKYVN